MNGGTDPDHSLDALLPADIARKAEDIGVQKTRMNVPSLLALAVLAGAFIALGGMFATTVLAGADGVVPFGISRLLSGLVFCLGLILVVVGGAELFTGNALMVMAWAAGEVRLREMLRAWAIVYVGNFVGAIGTAALVFLSGQYLAGKGSVAGVALNLALAKVTLSFDHALFLGILCNVLVCLAVWLAFDHRQGAGRAVSGVGFRGGRVRAFGRQHVSHPARPVHQGLGAGGAVGGDRRRRRQLRGADLAGVFRQPDPRDHRQHHRWRRSCRPRLLVHLSAAAPGGLTSTLPKSCPARRRRIHRAMLGGQK
jgi:formate/nitrite transporter